MADYWIYTEGVPQDDSDDEGIWHIARDGSRTTLGGESVKGMQKWGPMSNATWATLPGPQQLSSGNRCPECSAVWADLP